jgi:hypothetical protein
VLWHKNNLVVLFPRNSSNIDGVYVQVPISSFYAGKVGSLFTLAAASGATYSLVIQGKLTSAWQPDVGRCWRCGCCAAAGNRSWC